MTLPWKVMVVSSNVDNRRYVAGMLERQGVDAVCASTLIQFEELLQKREIGLVFCDPQFPDGSYQDVLAVTRYAESSPKVVVMSAEMTPEECHQAKLRGAFDIIPTPCRPPYIEWMVIMARRAWPVQAKAPEGLDPRSERFAAENLESREGSRKGGANPFFIDRS
jgi:DNA-binding NtrC family response regulator